MVFSTMGAAYGTSKAGIGIAGLGGFRCVATIIQYRLHEPSHANEEYVGLA